MSAEEPESREGLVDELADKVQADIMSGHIPIGTRLRQEQLAAEYSVSRTPIREALRRLQERGVLEVRPRRGAVVRPPSPREIREAYEVRAELEGFAAELAAKWINDAQLRRLHEAEGLFRNAVQHFVEARRSGVEPGTPNGPEHDWVRANDLFHEVVQEASGQERLRMTIRDLHRSFPRSLTWTALSQDSRLLDENVSQHNAILEAIAAGDAAAARRAMSEHVRRAGDLVARWFERLPHEGGREPVPTDRAADGGGHAERGTDRR